MEDELEDKVLYQTYLSHMKLLSQCGAGLPLNTAFLNYTWRVLRLCLVRPEILVISAILFLTFLYFPTIEVWLRGLYFKVLFNLVTTAKVVRLGKPYEGQSWELKEGDVAVYSVQGRRMRMEDRFVINENINNTGISLFAIFDGHGGEFAANYAKDVLIKNLNQKLVEVKKLKAEGPNLRYFKNSNSEANTEAQFNSPKSESSKEILERKLSFKKKSSVTDEYLDKSGNTGVPDLEFQKMLDGLSRPITKEVGSTSNAPPLSSEKVPLQSYLDSSKFSGIDYGKIISDEVLATDKLLLEVARKNKDTAGTTALIALMEGSHLVVANVGDSRGVMCDFKGNAIPLSFDHKPQQIKESKRIKEAGGFITFKGVWRVAGILATSRALGDYPLKHKNLVIADPDILTFDLSDHKPHFILLASDGLWDTFSNEGAVAFIKDHIEESHYGAKSITLQSYYRGSHDNITVIVINLKDKKWSSYTAKKKEIDSGIWLTMKDRNFFESGGYEKILVDYEYVSIWALSPADSQDLNQSVNGVRIVGFLVI